MATVASEADLDHIENLRFQILIKSSVVLGDVNLGTLIDDTSLNICVQFHIYLALTLFPLKQIIIVQTSLERHKVQEVYQMSIELCLTSEDVKNLVHVNLKLFHPIVELLYFFT